VSATGKYLLWVAALVGVVFDGRLSVPFFDLVGRRALRQTQRRVELAVVAL